MYRETITLLEENAASIVRDRHQRGALDAHNRERLQKRSRDQREDQAEENEAELAHALITDAAQPMREQVSRRIAMLDAAIVEEMMINQRLLDMLSERLALMRGNAIRLNDGRLGFDDGAGGYVDQTGRQITADELVDAEMPANGVPITTYDDFRSAMDEMEALEDRQHELRDLQVQSDEIQRQLESGSISAEDAERSLEGLEARLNSANAGSDLVPASDLDHDRAFVAPVPGYSPG